jgi:hypothetical protein
MILTILSLASFSHLRIIFYDPLSQIRASEMIFSGNDRQAGKAPAFAMTLPDIRKAMEWRRIMDNALVAVRRSGYNREVRAAVKPQMFF